MKLENATGNSFLCVKLKWKSRILYTYIWYDQTNESNNHKPISGRVELVSLTLASKVMASEELVAAVLCISS